MNEECLRANKVLQVLFYVLKLTLLDRESQSEMMLVFTRLCSENAQYDDGWRQTRMMWCGLLQE